MRTVRLKTNLGKQKQLSHCASVSLNLLKQFKLFKLLLNTSQYTVLILITQEMLLKFYYTGLIRHIGLINRLAR